MIKFISILLIALLFEAVGVAYLTSGLQELRKADKLSVSKISFSKATALEIVRVVKNVITSPKVLLGVFLDAIFFFMLLYMLANWDMSLVWPLTALNFVGTAIIAKFFLHEHVSPIRWTGITLILVGAMLAVYSEKVQEKERKAVETPVQTPATEVAR